jgi:hypothetical protein
MQHSHSHSSIPTCAPQACNLVGKPALITRVVDTMVNTPRPTRAEATGESHIWAEMDVQLLPCHLFLMAWHHCVV